MTFIPKAKRKKWEPKSHGYILTGCDKDEGLKSRNMGTSGEVKFINKSKLEAKEAKQHVLQRRTLVQLYSEKVVLLSSEDATLLPQFNKPKWRL